MSRHRPPVEEIRFAAKTGFLSYKLWDRYFAHGSYTWRFRQWNDLLSRGYFLAHPSPLAAKVIVPNKRHPLVRTLVTEVVSSPIINHFSHDECVYRGVLNLVNQNLIDRFLTEGELKLQNIGRDKVRSAMDRVKHPDAIVSKRDAQTIRIALEIELTRKAYKRYNRIIENYSVRKYADRVVFIASSEGIVKSLRKAVRENSYPQTHQPIGYMSLDDWESNPAEGPIHFGSEITSFKKLLCPSNALSEIQAKSNCG